MTPRRFVMSQSIYRVTRAVLRYAASTIAGDHRVQRTAATVTTSSAPAVSGLRELARNLREEFGAEVIIELQPSDPQCMDCGCIDALACEGGCTWAKNGTGSDLCSDCHHRRKQCPHCGSHPLDACDRDCPVYTEDCDGEHAPGACPLLTANVVKVGAP